MDIATRKINLISFLAQLQDEIFLEKLENMILKEENIILKNRTSLTEEELLLRIKKSESDYANGRYKTQEELNIISSDW